MQSLGEAAAEAMRKHPEIFSALEEYERTKKIPKFSYRKRLDITINQNILSAFKKHCQEKGLNMSRVIEKHIKDELQNKYL